MFESVTILVRGDQSLMKLGPNWIWTYLMSFGRIRGSVRCLCEGDECEECRIKGMRNIHFEGCLSRSEGFALKYTVSSVHVWCGTMDGLQAGYRRYLVLF